MNKKWLCEIHAISNITKQLETFISDEYIEAKTIQEARQIALEEYPYLNPIEEMKELEMFQFATTPEEDEIYFLEVSEEIIAYN